MKLKQINVYYDDIFDLGFNEESECRRFEEFCTRLKVVNVRYGTDFANGTVVLPQRGIIIVDSLVYEVDKLSQMVEYFLNTHIGSHYDCVGGKYAPANILPRWEYRWDTELDGNIFPCTLLGIISDKRMMKRKNKLQDNTQLGNILNSYLNYRNEE